MKDFYKGIFSRGCLLEIARNKVLLYRTHLNVCRFKDGVKVDLNKRESGTYSGRNLLSCPNYDLQIQRGATPAPYSYVAVDDVVEQEDLSAAPKCSPFLTLGPPSNSLTPSAIATLCGICKPLWNGLSAASSVRACSYTHTDH